MKEILGIELGSTRIKSVLINEKGEVLVKGGYEWENSFSDGIWTYSMDDVLKGLQGSFKDLSINYKEKYGEDLVKVDAIGISAMMHGYIALDDKDNLLVPFRTWRNTITEKAADELTELFGFNIPQRWSVSHFYQSVIDGLDHVKKVEHIMTLAAYVHYLLTGKRVLGIDDASGMFPVRNKKYDEEKAEKFNNLLIKHGINKDIRNMLPEILLAGESAGSLTKEGALILDPTGKLKSGIPLCPPEGDAGTGMVATNSVRVGTGNVSCGTSAFVMVVMDKPLKELHREIDVVSTPDGEDVAMVHLNNCTNEINAWSDLFGEVIELTGNKIDRHELFDKLYEKSLESDSDFGGILGYNFLSGEHVVGLGSGRPFVSRSAEGKFSLANFMQVQLYSSVAALSFGMDILHKEDVYVENIIGHGGFFKAPFVGQNVMSAVLKTPVTVMENSGEGGAWGIALLALYMTDNNKTLSDFLDGIFESTKKTTVCASKEDQDKFDSFITLYKKGLEAEKILVKKVNE